jgi:predicted MFS family arabinose efflux permease
MKPELKAEAIPSKEGKPVADIIASPRCDMADAKKGSADPSIEDAKFSDLLRSPRELWLVFALKALMSLSYFSLFNVLVLFLTDDLKLSDSSAGWVYGAHGVTVGVLSFAGGIVVDKLGSAISIYVGSACLLVGYGMVAFASNLTLALLGLLFFQSLGSALMMPALIVSLRRFTEPKARALAYSVFYVVMNVAAALSAMTIVAARDIIAGASWRPEYGGQPYSTWRMVCAFAFCIACLQMLLCFFVRAAPDDANPDAEVAERRGRSSWDIAKEVTHDPKFWRLAMLVLLMMGVRGLFRHMDVTFPKFFTRTFGPEARFEYFLTVNPICILCLTPPTTLVLQRYNVSFPTAFTLGAVISGISPFFLAWESSYTMCFAFLFVLSIGEAIWSPKLYEYSMAIAPIGREATYSALSGLPVFLTAGLIGGFSGHAVEHYCPAYGQCDGTMLWLIIGLSTVGSPIFLILFRSVIFKQDDLRDQHKGGLVSNEKDAGYGAVNDAEQPQSPASTSSTRTH